MTQFWNLGREGRKTDLTTLFQPLISSLKQYTGSPTFFGCSKFNRISLMSQFFFILYPNDFYKKNIKIYKGRVLRPCSCLYLSILAFSQKKMIIKKMNSVCHISIYVLFNNLSLILTRETSKKFSNLQKLADFFLYIANVRVWVCTYKKGRLWF